MTTARKAAANRLNSRKSRGPRGAAGRSTASRNALRHGLAALTHRSSAPDSTIESFARALCGKDDNTALLAKARVVAAQVLTLRTVAEQQTGLVDRLQDETAIALRKGDNSLTLMKARFMQAWLADYEIQKQVPALLEKYKDELPPEDLNSDVKFLVPPGLLALLHEPYTSEQRERALEIARQKVAQLGRDEHEAIAEAVPDLLRLERYHYRAWLRLKRAMYEFMNQKLDLNLKESAFG